MLAPIVKKMNIFIKQLLILPHNRVILASDASCHIISDANMIKNFRPIDQSVQGLSEIVKTTGGNVYCNRMALFFLQRVYNLISVGKYVTKRMQYS
jgi:hypothetical protein